MKGDFTRRTFRPRKFYSSVRMQQGRVQLDADWNEQAEIQQGLARSQAIDVIGKTGVPQVDGDAPGFRITVDKDKIFYSPGSIYVDGILCVAETAGEYSNQPDYPITLSAEDKQAGRTLVYLDVWERLITGLEDPEIIETALGGPDTAARVKTIWQVKLRSFRSDQDPTTLELNSTPPLPVVQLDTSAPPTGNQLYRVEIHDGIDAPGTGATVKWSRDNAAVVARWVDSPSVHEDRTATITVKGRTLFKEQQIVELTDDTHELLGKPGLLCKIIGVVNAPGKQNLTLEATNSSQLLGNLIDKFADDLLVEASNTGKSGRMRKVRLWSSAAISLLPGSAADPGITLRDEESGISSGVVVKFAPGVYQTGDAWLIAVRQGALDETAVVPADGGHHYAKLAVLDRQSFDDDVDLSFRVTGDLRPTFPSLTSLAGVTPRVEVIEKKLANGLATPTDISGLQSGIASLDAALQTLRSDALLKSDICIFRLSFQNFVTGLINGTNEAYVLPDLPDFDLHNDATAVIPLDGVVQFYANKELTRTLGRGSFRPNILRDPYNLKRQVQFHIFSGYTDFGYIGSVTVLAIRNCGTREIVGTRTPFFE